MEFSLFEEEHNTHIVEERNIGFKKASVEKEEGHLEERQSFVEPKKSLLSAWGG